MGGVVPDTGDFVDATGGYSAVDIDRVVFRTRIWEKCVGSSRKRSRAALEYREAMNAQRAVFALIGATLGTRFRIAAGTLTIPAATKS